MATNQLTINHVTDEEGSTISGQTYQQPVRTHSAGHTSLGHESGFQSTASLTSLPCGSMSGSMYDAPISALTGSYVENMSGLGRAPSDSMASLTSGISSFHLPSSYSPMVGVSGRRHSLNRLNDNMSGSRISLGRRSARNFVPSKEGVQFAQYRPVQWFLKPIFHEVPQREHNSMFVGRKWIWREMSEKLTDESCKGMLIAGAPGSGKTAVSLQLVHHSCFGLGGGGVKDTGDDLVMMSSQLVAYHFCQLDNTVTCRVPDWIHSTAAQLSQSPLMTAYHQLLSTDHDLRSKLSMTSCQSDPDSAFIAGLIQPLINLKSAGKISTDNCIILIDAIGDSHSHRPDFGDNIISFIKKHLDKLPPWLKLVITVRSDKHELVSDFGLSLVNLNQWHIDKRIEADISEYVSKRISKSQNIQRNITPQSGRQMDENPQVKFQNYLVSISKGCFLFVKMTLDLVDRGHLVIKSSSFKILPLSLSEVYMLEFNLKFSSDASFRKVSEILSVVLASLHPMTIAEIYQTVTSLYVDMVDSWQEFMMTYKSLAGYLVTRRDDSVMFFHPTLRDWLIRRSETETTKFMCDPRTGHAAIALKMSRMESPVNDEVTLELCHHILKAHLYRNSVSTSGVLSRDLQSHWISQSSDDVSLALAHPSNIHNPNINVSRLLLLSGASPDMNTDLSNNSPILCVYAKKGFTEMVSLLIEFGADINICDAVGYTPLSLASLGGHIETVRLLVENQAKLSCLDRTGCCPLVLAARHGHFAIVEYLVSCDWVSMSPQDLLLSEACQQAAVASAYYGHCDILEFMLDMAEVKIDGVDTLMMETPMCAAAASNKQQCVEILFRRGASVLATNLKAATPLHIASREGNFSICELLLKSGANIKLVDSIGRSVLMEACISGHLGVVELLVMKGADIEKSDNEKLTALLLACARGKREIVMYLLSHGADLNHVDSKSRSGLDLAAFHGDPSTVQLLLDHGAMMEHVDINGMRPLDRAISCGHVEVVKCFLKKGAKLGPSTWSMAESKPLIMLTLLNKLLEDGNTLFKKNKMIDAAQRYQYAVKRVPYTNSPHKPVFDQLRIHLLLNLARCKRKLFDHQEAIQLASQVLELQPNSYQGLHARAKAHHANGDLHLAVSDLTAAVRLAPDNRELHRILINLKQEMAAKSCLMSDNKSDKSHDSSSGVSSTTENGCITLQSVN